MLIDAFFLGSGVLIGIVLMMALDIILYLRSEFASQVKKKGEE